MQKEEEKNIYQNEKPQNELGNEYEIRNMNYDHTISSDIQHHSVYDRRQIK